jgi:hypothetical protein
LQGANPGVAREVLKTPLRVQLVWVLCNMTTALLGCFCFLSSGWTRATTAMCALLWCALSSSLVCYLMAAHG